MKKLPQELEDEFNERLNHWYKYYPFLHPNFSYPFEKFRLTKLYFKLEEVWCNYPAFWIAHYILKNRCEFCKSWDKKPGFCGLYEEITDFHDWCSGFKG